METQKNPQKWYDNTIIVHLLLVLVFPIGLYLLWQSTAYAKWWKVTATIIIAFLVIVNLGDTDNVTSTSKSGDSQAKVESVTTEPESYPTVGDKINTDYFEISLNKAWVVSKVKTGNQFSDVGPEEGNKFLILNITFKNIDSESRLFSDGSVFFDYNSEVYEFDKAETILAQGWGSLFDQLNPLISKTTNLVYKIPSEIQGGIVWIPGRNQEENGFFLLLDDTDNLVSLSSIGDGQTKVESEITQPEPIPIQDPIPTIGDKINTGYFEISLNKVWIDSKVKTGNQFMDIGPEAGGKFLILNITFKNIDTESRLFDEGSVFIDYNNKVYEFDKTEMILAEGWGSFFDQLNPLISKTTNLVYKIPSEIKGVAYWEPGRNYDKKRFFLGKI